MYSVLVDVDRLAVMAAPLSFLGTIKITVALLTWVDIPAAGGP